MWWPSLVKPESVNVCLMQQTMITSNLAEIWTSYLLICLLHFMLLLYKCQLLHFNIAVLAGLSLKVVTIVGSSHCLLAEKFSINIMQIKFSSNPSIVQNYIGRDKKYSVLCLSWLTNSCTSICIWWFMRCMPWYLSVVNGLDAKEGKWISNLFQYSTRLWMFIIYE
jgi:hypothetical protein